MLSGLSQTVTQEAQESVPGRERVKAFLIRGCKRKVTYGNFACWPTRGRDPGVRPSEIVLIV